MDITSFPKILMTLFLMMAQPNSGPESCWCQLPEAAEETIHKESEASLSPMDIDRSDPKDLSNFAEDERFIIHHALAAVGDEPDVSA